MNPHVERALILMQQSRHELAEEQLRRSLGEDPQDPASHALLALCLVEKKRYAEATNAAEQAIALAPDTSLPHYALSVVCYGRDHLPEAVEAIEQALAIDPDRSGYYAHLGRIRLQQSRWQEALAAAEQGLACDAEDAECANVRGIALTRLRRNDQAADALQATLARQPENPLTHANLGWTLLHQGQHGQALQHFREALRLDPEQEWARQGIVEALKARYLIYRLMLGYFLWTMTLSAQTRWLLLVGSLVCFNVLRRAARIIPALAPYVWPVLALYLAFAMMTWIASPMFNLLLRLNRFGRLTLSREQIRTSTWVALCVAGFFGSIVAYLITRSQETFILAICCGLLIPSISKIYDCDPGWPRRAMQWTASGLLALASLGVTFLMLRSLHPEGPFAPLLGGLGSLLFFAFIIGAVASQFTAHWLVNATVRK